MEETPGRPVKIVEFLKNQNNSDNKSEAVFYESNLKSVLESADNCPISIISIAGASHDGKTFFLSSFVTYFEHSASSDDNETIECQWPSANEVDTSGIYLWSVPYKLQSGTFDATTVFLMNIHQSNDITEEQLTSLLGLSSLISSHVIENPFENVPRSITEFQETLQSCESNIIALRPKEETLHGVPVRNVFQTCFWTSKDKELLESLARYYEELEQEIQVIPATGRNKDELVEELDFMECDDLVQNDKFPEMLNFIQIPLKKIFERMLVESDFISCCKAYMSLFQSGADISSDNIEKKSAEVALRIFVSFSVFEYEQEMNGKLSDEQIHSDLGLIQHHLKAEKSAKGSFEWNLAHSSSIVQSQEMPVYKHELNFLIFTKFQKAQSDNEIRRNEWVENMRLERIQKFQNPRAPRFFNEEAFHDETQLRQICSREITLKLTYFKEKVAKYFDDEVVIKEVQKTRDLFEQELEKLLEENKRRKAAAEGRTKELLDRNVQKLADKIGNQMALEFVTQKLLEPTDDQAKLQTLNQGMCCSICFDEQIGVAFQCGHVIGRVCYQKLQNQLAQRGGQILSCHKCRKPVQSSIKLYF